jgi:hypothetical protein
MHGQAPDKFVGGHFHLRDPPLREGETLFPSRKDSL